MSDSQATRVSLLMRLRACSDHQAWSDFVDLYSPIIYGFARRQGLQDSDAADLVQEVLVSLSKSVRRYDHQRGPFRGWLMGVVRNHLREFWSKRAREASGSGDSEVRKQLNQVEADEELERLWEEEYVHSIFRAAAKRVRNNFEQSTWAAFWETCVEGHSTNAVADRLGLSAGAVYIAKCRVLAQVREQVRILTE